MKKSLIVFLFLVLAVEPAMWCKQKKSVEKVPVVVSQWNGRRVGFLGDSIIDERQLNTNNTFPHLLESLLGIEPHVYGISGREWNDIPRQTAAMEDELGQDVDAIVIFIGTNDFNHAVPLGEWYAEHSETVTVSGPMDVIRRHRTLVMDEGTLRGRINIAMNTLRAKYPTKQIIVLTPIHRALFDHSPQNHQPDELYTNAIGLYIDDYVRAIREVADVWAVPVIDLFSLSGLYPLEPNQGPYYRDAQRDRLHPNTLGHTRIAYTLAYQLAALPAVFE